mmetsp:Transcript_7146/g.19593  ORF Transcript_7146/g.19593 Transcript_7146/m.19593 type:complete len:216 (-) Transcript_7146:11-658(-)
MLRKTSGNLRYPLNPRQIPVGVDSLRAEERTLNDGLLAVRGHIGYVLRPVPVPMSFSDWHSIPFDHVVLPALPKVVSASFSVVTDALVERLTSAGPAAVLQPSLLFKEADCCRGSRAQIGGTSGGQCLLAYVSQSLSTRPLCMIPSCAVFFLNDLPVELAPMIVETVDAHVHTKTLRSSVRSSLHLKWLTGFDPLLGSTLVAHAWRVSCPFFSIC